MKKIIALVLAIALVATCLAGCGNKESASSGGDASSDKPFAGKEINVLMEDVSDCDYIIQLVPEFEEATGIKVNIESISYSTMHEKVAAQMVSSTNAYDVIIVDCYWTGEFADAGWMLSLDEYVERDGFDMSPYIESITDMDGYVDGVLYQIPYYNYGMCTIYNTDIWENEEIKEAYKKESGKELTLKGETVAEYVDMCKFISNYYGKDTIAGLVQQSGRGDPIVMEWLNWFFGCGGQWFDENGKSAINSDAALEACKLYKDALENASPTGAISFNLDDAQMMLAGGQAASMVNYNWQIATLNNMENTDTAGKFAFADSPGGVPFVGAWGWSIPHNAVDADLSWEFIKWVESFDICKKRALLGGAPTRTDIFADEEVIAKYPYSGDISESLTNGIGMPIVSDSNGMIEALTTALSEIVAGEKEAQTALDEVADYINNMD